MEHDKTEYDVTRLVADASQLPQPTNEPLVDLRFGQRDIQSVIRAIIENTPDAIIMKDLEGRYVIVNSSMARIIGVPLEQIVGTTDAELFPSDTADQLVEHDSQVIIAEEAQVYEEVLPVDGMSHTFLVTKTTCHNDNGRTIGTLGIAHDITERKQSEQALARARDELERRVEEQTSEIRTANRILRERLTKLEQMEKSLRGERRLLKRLLDVHERDRQLIAFEIHDGMVQDLTAAQMFVESSARPSCEQKSVDENLAKSKRLIQRSINEARRLINGLRPPVLEHHGIVAAIENLVEEMKAMAGIEIGFEHDIRFGRVAAALETAMYRIVQEGLNNVWKHSESTRAHVSLIQLDDRVAITVRDWGTGFDHTQRDKRGYGLKGVEERARLLGGSAKISSVPGEGTTIEVVLPVTDVILPVDTDADRG